MLVGQSLGGMAGMLYASRRSDRLRALVLVDVGPVVRLDGANRVADFVMAPAELDSVDAFVEKARSFNSRRDPRLLRISLLHNLRQLPNGKWTWKYDRRHLSREGFEELTTRARGSCATSFRASPARPSWSGAPRATSSRTPTPSTRPISCRTGAGSGSRAPATPSRATTPGRSRTSFARSSGEAGQGRLSAEQRAHGLFFSGGFDAVRKLGALRASVRSCCSSRW